MRRRRYVSPWKIALARPFLRYSETRCAYVLRVVGNKRGPVLRPGPDPGLDTHARFTRDGEAAGAPAEAPPERIGAG